MRRAERLACREVLQISNVKLANVIRLNYILWIQDLIDTTGDEYQDLYDPDRDVVGLDM